MIPDFAELTRRRDPHRRDEWQIYCGDIHAGTIAKAVGMPNAHNDWNWSAGFYPGSGPGDTFEQARAAFLPAWLAKGRKPEDFDEWREWQDWTARKYAARDASLPVPRR